MKFSKYMSWSNMVRIGGCAVVVLFFIAILMPVGAHKSTAKPILALSNIKHLSTATTLYNSDYDYRYPHAIAMPAVRALVHPYCKNIELYKGISGYSTNPTMNFNLSGVLATDDYSLPLSASKTDIPGSHAVLFYSVVTGKEAKDAAIVSYADMHAKKFKSMNPLLSSLAIQFDRTGVTLASADYLADQDPLRGETK